METYKTGLVLSGGGARGAYEVGVIKALARLNFEPQVVAGASIGALNGAVVAASPTLGEAAETLEAIWTGIDEDAAVRLDVQSTARLISLIGLHLALRIALKANPVTFATFLATKPILKKFFTKTDKDFIAILDSSPMEELLAKSLDFERLLEPEGREFYVSVFPSKGGELLGTVRDVIRWAGSQHESLFPRVKDFSQSDAVKLILASAAIPPALKAVSIQDQVYRDGGMGGRVEEQGNTPMKPLADLGCKCVILVTLKQGALWNRNEWPGLVPIEIRPLFDICNGYWIKSLFDFNPVRIRELMRHGEEDAMRVLGDIAKGAYLVSDMRESQKELAQATKNDPEKEKEYEQVMQALREQLTGL